MPATTDLTLGRRERIKGKKAVDQLFHNNDGHALTAFPLRVVYVETERIDETPTKFMVSVPKRCLKRAVWRNRVKRQVREAFRLNQQKLSVPDDKTVLLAFIWMDSKIWASRTVEHRMRDLLQRLGGRI
ncbi:MAG: ribonuclease P protein component [Prevotella sp.]|nr:ribonuclease P protein component [Prevotella sp.]